MEVTRFKKFAKSLNEKNEKKEKGKKECSCKVNEKKLNKKEFLDMIGKGDGEEGKGKTKAEKCKKCGKKMKKCECEK